ncbi:MAG: glycosyltransferase family 39 protein [Actinomycetales bacterium]|nr:glycosyltransferase family 39 protein [Actinomycetales bacterium]
MKYLKHPDSGRFDWFWVFSLLSLTLYSGLAYLFDLANGQRSEFYGAIAKSMSLSLGNWWWGAADPAGTITLDKIPGSYWVPAIFVKLFGFSTWSVNVPNALASIAAVLVIAFTARRLGGSHAGLIAGAIAATTPILAAVARSNQPESFFLLSLALVAYFGVRALREASFKHLMLAGAFIALAFHSYMLVAWAAWPALGLAWLTVKKGWGVKIWQLLVAGFTSLLLSLIWIISVSLTPASVRPYIGGSNGNSAWEMVFGYNGLGRFSGLTGTTASSTVRGFTPPFSGSPSVFRLVNSQLLPQIGWLVPAALVAIAVIIISRRVKPESWFVISFFAIYAVLFSVVAGMHQFYTAELGLGLALLLAQAYSVTRDRGDRIGPVVIVVVSAITTMFIAIQYAGYQSWAPIVQLALAVAAVVLILVGLPTKAGWILPVVLAGSLTLSPAVWAADVYKYPSSINPVAGPSNVMGTFGGSGMGANGGPGMGGFGGGGVTPGAANVFGSNTGTDALLNYLKANRHGAKYLVAMFGTMTAAPYITASGENIVPIGGFDGADPSPTLSQLKSWIRAGDLRYVLISSGGGFGGGAPGGMGGTGGMGGSGSSTASVGSANTTAIQTWVKANCSLSDYSGGGLYECAPDSANK